MPNAPVPHLPPAFGVSDDDVRPGGRSMLDLLIDDHHRLLQLCSRLMSAAHDDPTASTEPSVSPAAGTPAEAEPAAARTGPTWKTSAPTWTTSAPTWTTSARGASPRDVQDVLVATLARHLSAEEQYLYPTVRKVLPEGRHLADQELVADTQLLETLRRLQATARDDAAYPQLVARVASQLSRHTHRTSREVFPRLRERCTDNELIRLGNRVEVAREAAPTRPHPRMPHTPPLNKLVDPAVGVVDKVRDALTRRTTWPEDLTR